MLATGEWGAKGVKSEGLRRLQNGQSVSTQGQIAMIAQLSWPAVLAQMSSIVMQYIDTAMVGQLGANASAAIGVVSTTTWLFGDLCIALAVGFSVAVAQLLGARQPERARAVVKMALITCAAFSVAMMCMALGITRELPHWLRADRSIWQDASAYFLMYALSLPFAQLNSLCGGLLRASGNMKTPGICMVLMCLMDVVFNAFLIFPGGTLRVAGLPLPGFGLGVIGASAGTALAKAVSAFILAYTLLARSPELSLRRGESLRWSAAQLRRCLGISAPVMGEQAILAVARMATTYIVAPLGIIATAANAFAITAESLCYMPAYGVQEAASTLVGQSVGAGRRDMTYRLGWMTVALGLGLMTAAGVLMYLMAPAMMRMMSTDESVISLGICVLRIEAFAEPMYGASIVAGGVFQGAGSTLTPMLLNLGTMWGVRVPLSALLANKMGLVGVWIAMALQLVLCGICFLICLMRRGWLPRPHSCKTAVQAEKNAERSGLR